MIEDYSQQDWPPEVRAMIDAEKDCMDLHIKKLFLFDHGLALGILTSQLSATLLFVSPENRKRVKEDIIRYINAISMDAFEDFQDMISFADEFQSKIRSGEINEGANNEKAVNDPSTEQPPDSTGN